MAETLLVRDARSTDLEGLASVCYADSPAIHRGRLRDAALGHLRFLVAELGGTIVGFGLLVFSCPETWPDAETTGCLPGILDLHVAEVVRNQGIRTAMIGRMEEMAIAVTVFSVGATITHVMDILATGNLAPGNTMQNVGNLLRPALLITFLALNRRADKGGEPERAPGEYERWRVIPANWAAWIAGGVAMGFGIGSALGRGLLGALLGVAGGALVAAATTGGISAARRRQQS